MKKLVAFAIIYLVWGSTFLAIRIGVAEVPPFLLAGLRFVVAGGLLAGWTFARGQPLPTRRQWLSVVLLAALIFVGDYGLVFWAEQWVPSGITAVLMATIALFMALGEIAVLRTRRLTLPLGLALLIGMAGVAILMSRSARLGTPIDQGGAGALIVAALCWSAASILTRKLPLPASLPLSSGVQMLVGGGLLLLTAAALGELPAFAPSQVSSGAWLALLYLIVPGSLVAFTAYLWLIQRESPTRVGTYAYVNPVVAVLLGHFLGGEALDRRTILGTLLVLLSVGVILTARERSS